MTGCERDREPTAPGRNRCSSRRRGPGLAWVLGGLSPDDKNLLVTKIDEQFFP